jgi:hypothetical protein
VRPGRALVLGLADNFNRNLLRLEAKKCNQFRLKSWSTKSIVDNRVAHQANASVENYLGDRALLFCGHALPFLILMREEGTSEGHLL